MADNTIYDLLDEVNCADSCEAVTALCELIDELLKDISTVDLIQQGIDGVISHCHSPRFLHLKMRGVFSWRCGL